jgi:hypothetical protein
MSSAVILIHSASGRPCKTPRMLSSGRRPSEATPKPLTRVALCVEIDDQGAQSDLHERGREIDRDTGLSNTTLLK